MRSLKAGVRDLSRAGFCAVWKFRTRNDVARTQDETSLERDVNQRLAENARVPGFVPVRLVMDDAFAAIGAGQVGATFSRSHGRNGGKLRNWRCG